MLFPVESIWCCLATTERGLSTALVNYYITPPGYIEQATFDVLYALADPMNSFPRKEQYIYTYALIADVIVNPDESETPIYRFGTNWWPQLFVFFSTHDTNCPQPCAYVAFPP